jgi:hypothetical protein
VYILPLNPLKKLHLARYPYSKEVKPESELLGRESTEGESQILQVLISLFKDLGSMYIKAIEAYSEIVTVECECVWLVGVGCCLDPPLHLSECTDEGNVI